MRMADASALIRQYCTRPATVVRLLYTMQNSWTSAIDHYMILNSIRAGLPPERQTVVSSVVLQLLECHVNEDAGQRAPLCTYAVPTVLEGRQSNQYP
jgi:hypothetical protein